jgi:hypothetical protein
VFETFKDDLILRAAARRTYQVPWLVSFRFGFLRARSGNRTESRAPKILCVMGRDPERKNLWIAKGGTAGLQAPDGKKPAKGVNGSKLLNAAQGLQRCEAPELARLPAYRMQSFKVAGKFGQTEC